VNPQILSTHLVVVTKNAQNTAGNWLCQDKGLNNGGCGVPTPTPKPTLTPTPTISPNTPGRMEVSVVNQNTQYMQIPSDSSANIYGSNSPGASIIGTILNPSEGWANNQSAGGYGISVTTTHTVVFGICINCKVPTNFSAGNNVQGFGPNSYFPSVNPGQTTTVFIKFLN
jgi:hypothetical protein